MINRTQIPSSIVPLHAPGKGPLKNELPVAFSFSRFAPSGYGYELSSKGDTRFSALYAKLIDGRTIEQAYQLDVKGFRSVSNDWRAGKGKLPINGASRDQIWEGYLQLWTHWARENPHLIEDLREKARGKTLTDMFAATPVSQARALAIILNETSPGKVVQRQCAETERVDPINPDTVDSTQADLQVDLFEDAATTPSSASHSRMGCPG